LIDPQRADQSTTDNDPARRSGANVAQGFFVVDDEGFFIVRRPLSRSFGCGIFSIQMREM
jgi:hypothetical protein